MPIDRLLLSLVNIANVLVILGSTLAVVAFFFGLAKYIWAAGDEKAAKEGKSIMTWGVIAMFILVCIGGIIGFLQKSTGADIAPTVRPVTVPPVNAYPRGFPIW